MDGADGRPDSVSIDALVQRIGGGPSLHTLTVAEARAASLARRQLIATGREAVALVRDLVLPLPGGDTRARLYAPREGAPVLLYLHGGGWVIGGLDSSDALCRPLANRSGCSIVSLDYPLAPEHPYPAASEAAYAAALWLAAHGRTIGVDQDRLAVGGSSAGGNLSAAVALMARDRVGPPLRLQLVLFPPMDATIRTAPPRAMPLLTRDEMNWFWDHYLGSAQDPTAAYASPLRADVSGVAPALVVTAEFDVLREEGDAYAAKLRDAGVAVWHRSYPTMVHGFLGLAAELPEADDALYELARELRSALDGDPPVDPR
ncbi:MAG: alpha/beta hydrolase [Candidatus Limnocylindria bacterium]